MDMSIQKVQAQTLNALPIRSVSDIEALGRVIAQSNLFGEGVNPAAGMAIAAMCHQDGMSYSRWMQNYHLIQGKVSKRADAMLADFQRMGGHFSINQRNADGASVTFKYDGNEYKSDCIWAEIKTESFVKGKNGAVKDKYATPRSRMQMLWARAVSDGLRVICPQCCQGVYTPEEVSDFDAPPTGGTAPVTARKPARRVASVSAEAECGPAEQSGPAEEPAADATPFDEPAAVSDENATDPTVCPIPGNLYGQKWEEMPTRHLRLALGFPAEKVPALTDAHRNAIVTVLDTRNEPKEANDEQ